MKKAILITSLLLAGTLAKAQTGVHSPEVRAKDSTVMKDIFEPMAAEAANNETTPDWSGLKTTLTAKYGADYAERFTWEAKVYFDYSRDWPAFCTALIYYTNTYESMDDLRRLNINAKMILDNSSDPQQLQTALGWSKRTVDKDSANADYQKTYTALQAKLAAK